MIDKKTKGAAVVAYVIQNNQPHGSNSSNIMYGINEAQQMKIEQQLETAEIQ